MRDYRKAFNFFESPEGGAQQSPPTPAERRKMRERVYNTRSTWGRKGIVGEEKGA